MKCFRTVDPSLLSSCQNIVDTMSASRDFTTWGPHDDPLAVVKLPLVFYSREFIRFFLPKFQHWMTRLIEMMHLEDGRCRMNIRTDGRTDTFSMYQFWTVAVALTGICVRGGQAGMRADLGKSWFHEAFGKTRLMRIMVRPERSPLHGYWSCVKG